MLVLEYSKETYAGTRGVLRMYYLDFNEYFAFGTKEALPRNRLATKNIVANYRG